MDLASSFVKALIYRKKVIVLWKVLKRNYETLADSFMPHEIARPVDRADKRITIKEYESVQEYYREECSAKSRYTE